MRQSSAAHAPHNQIVNSHRIFAKTQGNTEPRHPAHFNGRQTRFGTIRPNHSLKYEHNRGAEREACQLLPDRPTHQDASYFKHLFKNEISEEKHVNSCSRIFPPAKLPLFTPACNSLHARAAEEREEGCWQAKFMYVRRCCETAGDSTLPSSCVCAL